MTTSITLQVSSDLERQLRAGAARAGVQLDRFIHRVLEEQFSQAPASASRHSKKEAALLQKINRGFPSEFWEEYDRLIAKRRAETLSEGELAALIECSDRVEKANAERMKHLLELASLRQVPLDALMEQLGVKPRNHA